MEDDRFIFADKAKLNRYQDQLIAGYETKTYTPRSAQSSSDIKFGDTLEFQLDNEPFCVSRLNYVEIKGQLKQKAVGETAWEPATMPSRGTLAFCENFSSALFPYIALRQGLDVLETDGLQPRGRYLWENFVNAHMDLDAVKANRLEYDVDHEFSAFSKDDWLFDKPLQTSDGNRLNNFAVNTMAGGQAFYFKLRPHCFPFSFSHPYLQKDILFPNTGQPATLILGMESNLSNLVVDRASPKTHDYKLMFQSVKVHLIVPRLTPLGLDVVKKSSRMSITYPDTYRLQHSQVIPDNASEVYVTMQHTKMPHYILLQLYEQDYFLPRGSQTQASGSFLYRAKESKIAKISMKFGGKELNYNTSNLNIHEPDSALLRQEIFKRSGVLGIPIRQDYFSKVKHYNHPHILLSLCSNEKTKEKLLPLDLTTPLADKQMLEMVLESSKAEKLAAGRLLIRFLYINEGHTYNMSKGVFVEPDIKLSIPVP